MKITPHDITIDWVRKSFEYGNEYACPLCDERESSYGVEERGYTHTLHECMVNQREAKRK